MIKSMTSLRRISIAACSVAAMGSASAQEKTYNVALDGTLAPHAMPTLNGGVEGFNVDLANAIGEKLGAKMNITATQFSGLIPAMEAGTYDFIVAPTTITEERTKNMLFVEGYLDTDFQFVTKADAPDVSNLEQLRGKVIAVNRGSAYESWLKERAEKYGWTVTNYGTNADATQAVMSGRAFADFAANTVAAWAVKQNQQLKLSYLVDTGLFWSMPFRNDDNKTRDMVDRVIECLKMDGTMTKLSEKWFGMPPAKGSTALTPIKGYGQPGFAGYEDDDHKPSCDGLKG